MGPDEPEMVLPQNFLSGFLFQPLLLTLKRPTPLQYYPLSLMPMDEYGNKCSQLQPAYLPLLLLLTLADLFE